MKKYLDNLRQYQFLLSELVKKEQALKYRRSYLGILRVRRIHCFPWWY